MCVCVCVVGPPDFQDFSIRPSSEKVWRPLSYAIYPGQKVKEQKREMERNAETRRTERKRKGLGTENFHMQISKAFVQAYVKREGVISNECVH